MVYAGPPLLIPASGYGRSVSIKLTWLDLPCFKSRLNHLRKGGIPGPKEEFRLVYEDWAIDYDKVCMQYV